MVSFIQVAVAADDINGTRTCSLFIIRDSYQEIHRPSVAFGVSLDFVAWLVAGFGYHSSN